MKKLTSVLLILLVLMTSIPVSASGYSRTMQFTHKGEDVLELQKTLKQMGYYNYNLDGIYGKITEKAVITNRPCH